jgi:hypothetical protein
MKKNPLKDYDDVYLECRAALDGGHTWVRAEDDGLLKRNYPASRNIYRWANICTTCDAYKVRAMNLTTGMLIGNTSMRLPKGYTVKGGVKKAKARVEMVSRHG